MKNRTSTRHSQNSLESRTDDFIEKGQRKHGKHRYDYSMSDYCDRSTRVTLRCDECGHTFSVTPQDHIFRQKNRYAGCLVCHDPGRKVSEATSIIWKERLSERIDAIKEKEYRSELRIICRECGTLFMMKADSHVSHKRYGGCKIVSFPFLIKTGLKKPSQGS